MFAVYALAVASMKPADCIRIFGERRPVLVSRYRRGALRALSDTDLLSTRDLEVLQAFALILVSAARLVSPPREGIKSNLLIFVRLWR